MDSLGIATLTRRTPRLVLRLLHEADRAEYIRMYTLSAAHLEPWSPAWPPGKTFEQMFDERVERARRAAIDGTGARFAAFADARLVGMFNLNNIVRGVFQNADAGWLVSADALGQGFATEGVVGLLDLAFLPPPRGLGLHRVQANIMPHNARSLRVAAKAGFRQEGFAKRMVEIAGQWQDHIMFAKLTDEHEVR